MRIQTLKGWVAMHFKRLMRNMRSSGLFAT